MEKLLSWSKFRKLVKKLAIYKTIIHMLIFFLSAFLRDFSLWLDRMSGDGSLRHLAQLCCVALGRALICVALSRVDHLMHSSLLSSGIEHGSAAYKAPDIPMCQIAPIYFLIKYRWIFSSVSFYVRLLDYLARKIN